MVGSAGQAPLLAGEFPALKRLWARHRLAGALHTCTWSWTTSRRRGSRELSELEDEPPDQAT
jgi:hypothetical protein